LKNSNLCDHNSPTSQTDRQTDRQTTCDRNTALCTKVHRAVKSGTAADDLASLNNMTSLRAEQLGISTSSSNIVAMQTLSSNHDVIISQGRCTIAGEYTSVTEHWTEVSPY